MLKDDENVPSLTDHFHRFESIGSGGFGAVEKAIEKETNEVVAIKTIDKKKLSSETSSTCMQHEIDAMTLLEHDHIVKLKKYFQNCNHIFLVMEYCPEGDLCTYIRDKGPLHEHTAAHIFSQIVEAVGYCHSKGIAHRDLKLENILISQFPFVKISDFGMCTFQAPGGKLCTSFCGSIFYTAPEILCKVGYDPMLADIWSLGVILYIIVTGNLPWEGSLTISKQVAQQILVGAYQPLPNTISQLCRKLIQSLIQVNPSKRLSIEQISKSDWLESMKNTPHSLPPPPPSQLLPSPLAKLSQLSSQFPPSLLSPSQLPQLPSPHSSSSPLSSPHLAPSQMSPSLLASTQLSSSSPFSQSSSAAIPHHHHGQGKNANNIVLRGLPKLPRREKVHSVILRKGQNISPISSSLPFFSEQKNEPQQSEQQQQQISEQENDHQQIQIQQMVIEEAKGHNEYEELRRTSPLIMDQIKRNPQKTKSRIQSLKVTKRHSLLP